MRRMYSKPQLLEAVEEESKLTGIKVFEDIKDKNGNPRFIDGIIAIESISGVSLKYGYWSLSGTHLLIVIAGNVVSGTSLTDTTLAKVNIPQWILDKIVVISGNYVVSSSGQFYGESGLTNYDIYLRKQPNRLDITCGTLVPAEDMSFRIQYDLLIDNI